MTEEEGSFYIAIALLHAPSTMGDAVGLVSEKEPFRRDADDGWWVYRDPICAPSFRTRAEAALHYCKHYNLTE